MKTIWVRIHKNNRLVLRYQPGELTHKDGHPVVKSPNVLIGIVTKGGAKSYFALSPEEVLRLAETLRVVGVQMIREETELQAKYDAELEKLRREREAKEKKEREEVAEWL